MEFYDNSIDYACAILVLAVPVIRRSDSGVDHESIFNVVARRAVSRLCVGIADVEFASIFGEID